MITERMQQLAGMRLDEMVRPTMVIKIDGVPSDFDKLPFGRQIEHRKAIKEFQKTAKSEWVGMKGKKGKPEIMKFLKSVGAKQYYATWIESNYAKDDSTEVWYKR